MGKAILAIVGRPNVGKSTLFNTLAGEKISIVEDHPGVTRDRIYADVTWLNHSFSMIDTGGIEMDSKDKMLKHMREQADIAIDTADVILFLVDVRQRLGTMETEVVKEFFMGLASGAQMNLHIKQLAGENTHHVVEAMFKAVAKSMDMASKVDDRIEGVLSTKGVL